MCRLVVVSLTRLRGERLRPANYFRKTGPPDSPGAVVRLKDGRLVMCWNDIQSYPNGVSGHFRQHLYAAISNDNGATWSKSRRVAPLQSPENPGSRGDYPYLCETADGAVLLYYTRFGLRPGASYEKQHNELVRLDAAWLKEAGR